jgi:heavy metal sensor kinase
MVLVLGVYAVAVFTFVSTNASNALNARLRDDFRWASEMVEQVPNGSLVMFEGDDGSAEPDRPWLQVSSPDGDVLVRSMFAEQHPIAQARSLASYAYGQIVSTPAGGATFRLLTDRSTIGGRPVIIQVAVSENSTRREKRDLLLILLLGLPFGVAVAGIGGYSLARRALAPVDRMAEQAHQITAERLSERLPIDNPDDELGRLASVFNETLGRLEASFDQMRRFTADISHELRTPLAAIRSVGEVGLRSAKDQGALREVVGSMLEEVDRLACLVEQLLMLSRAETGQARLSLEEIDLHDLAADVVSHLGVLAEEKRQKVTVDAAGSPRSVADRLVLRQALLNLVDNAIKYTPADGQIAIRLRGSGSEATIEVSDSGPGVSVEPRERVFDRFYRADRRANDVVGGTGLGLAIAKWAVEVNGGRLVLDSPNGAGSTFRITLPAAQARSVKAAPAA